MTTYVMANWKMHKTADLARLWASTVLEGLPADERLEAVVFPAFPLLGPVAEAACGTTLRVGAQNMHAEDEGAFTGEVSAPMLTELGVRYVLIGHSERRQITGETDRELGRKLEATVRHDLRPVYCVGDSTAEHERQDTAAALRKQYGVALKGTSTGVMARLVIAYEPVWAIGSGLAATPDHAQLASASIRQGLTDLFGHQVARSVPILYGGSVSVDNVQGYLRQPDVDGVLVGGASLDGAAFVAMCRAAVLA